MDGSRGEPRQGGGMASRIPNGCAAIIEVAQGMMMFGDREIGRAMLRDLLQQATANNCVSRPECARALALIATMVGDDEHPPAQPQG